MSSNKKSDNQNYSPCLKVSVDQTKIRGSDEKDFQDSKLQTQVLLTETANLKRTTPQEFDASSDNKMLVKPQDLDQLNQKQCDNNQVQIQEFKEELVQNKKKRRGGKKHKKNKKDNCGNELSNSEILNAKDTENNTSSNKNIINSCSIIDQEPKYEKIKYYDCDIKKEIKFDNPNEIKNFNKQEDESVNQENSTLDADIYSNLNKTSLSQNLNTEEEDGIIKVKNLISFQQEEMQKEETKDPKKNLNDTISDSIPTGHPFSNETSKSDEYDNLRTGNEEQKENHIHHNYYNDEHKLFNKDLNGNENITSREQDEASIINNFETHNIQNEQITKNFIVKQDSEIKLDVIPITKLDKIKVEDYKIESNETADLKDNIINVYKIDDQSFLTSGNYKPTDLGTIIETKTPKPNINDTNTIQKPQSSNRLFENELNGNKISVKSSLPIRQSNTYTNELISNNNHILFNNDRYANTLTGHIKESYTKSMTVVRKTEDSLMNMRNKQIKGINNTDAINLNNNLNNRSGSVDSHDETGNANVKHLAHNHLLDSNSCNNENNHKEFEVIDDNGISVPIQKKQGNQNASLNSHFYKSQGNLSSHGIVRNASQDNFLNIQNTNENIPQQEPKSATKIDDCKQYNIYDKNEIRGLSRSKSKQDLLNKSITRSNPLSSVKKYADFRQDNNNEQIIIERKQSLRNSENRNDLDPTIRTEYVSNVFALNNSLSTTKLTYNNTQPGSIKPNELPSSPQTKLKPNDDDNYCRTIENLENEIISEDQKEKSGLKMLSQTKSEMMNSSDDSNVKNELIQLKQKYQDLKSDQDDIKSMNEKYYQILSKYSVN